MMSGIIVLDHILILENISRVHFQWSWIWGSYSLWKCHTIIKIPMIFHQADKLLVLGVLFYKWGLILAFFFFDVSKCCLAASIHLPLLLQCVAAQQTTVPSLLCCCVWPCNLVLVTGMWEEVICINLDHDFKRKELCLSHHSSLPAGKPPHQLWSRLLCDRNKLLSYSSPRIFILVTEAQPLQQSWSNVNYNVGFPGSYFLCL